MIQYIRRVSHAKSKHSMFRHYFQDLLQKLRDGSADIPAVSSGVFRCDPYLKDAFNQSLLHSIHYGARVIRSEFASGMPCLAIGALA